MRHINLFVIIFCERYYRLPNINSFQDYLRLNRPNSSELEKNYSTHIYKYPPDNPYKYFTYSIVWSLKIIHKIINFL